MELDAVGREQPLGEHQVAQRLALEQAVERQVVHREDALARRRRMQREVGRRHPGVPVVPVDDVRAPAPVDVAAPDVLLLRPALINVAVTAPDVRSANMRAVVVRSAGQATLFLALFDSATSTLRARVMDARADNQPIGQIANRVTNTAAANQVLTSWAVELRRYLDAVRDKPEGQ